MSKVKPQAASTPSKVYLIRFRLLLLLLLPLHLPNLNSIPKHTLKMEYPKPKLLLSSKLSIFSILTKEGLSILKVFLA